MLRKIDYILTDHGSLWLIEPCNPQAAATLKQRAENVQWLGNCILLDCKLVEEFRQRLEKDGWITGEFA